MKSYRTWLLYLFPLAVLAYLFHTDPDGGLATRDMLTGLVSVCVAVVVAHFARKSIFDYLKMQRVFEAAMRSPTGAGLVFLGVCLVLGALLLVAAPRAHAQDVRTYVPAGAHEYALTLKAEQMRLWPTHPRPAMLGALVELESCITLRHSRCWNPSSRLRTSREEGAGMGQLTRAFHPDGSIRFDALADARGLDPSLRELSWSTIYQRPDLQLRTMVAMNRDCFRRVARMVDDPLVVLEFCDAAYNGGYAGMQRERRACGLRAGCDPDRWFGHVERVCLKSSAVMPGYGRSPCEINRHHVHEVAVVRWPKYVPLLGA
ncbi:MAG TPA: hypothetical protein VNT52_01025 [Acidimicrobiales bacterium]|nr:hypothetical protein [Acidimicrobiales bacterium]